jgi:hypothetical protein
MGFFYFQFSVTDLFRHKELLTPLIIGLVMQLSQQWGGINAVSERLKFKVH